MALSGRLVYYLCHFVGYFPGGTYISARRPFLLLLNLSFLFVCLFCDSPSVLPSPTRDYFVK